MELRHGVFQTGEDQWHFNVWAPFHNKVEIEIQGSNDQPHNMEKGEDGYWFKTLVLKHPVRYKYILDKKVKLPDPASRHQPEGVHGWSQTYAQNTFKWIDHDWKGIPLTQMIIYEIHTGTFTPEGTFNSLLSRLDHLLALGINTIEIMPVAQFPGERNWGYDGVYPYAVQNNYGGPDELKQLVDCCHQRGIAVILDVVYNHLGPEGNYLSQYGPYFTDKYSTPWGDAINFDDAYSGPVREFFIQNAIMWLDEFHLDGLRLDAVHAILDFSPAHFLKELRQRVDQLEVKNGRQYLLIAESDMNDVKLLKPYDKGGYELNAQWADDFHHALHTLSTGESSGYYTDYGTLDALAKAFRQAFIYDGEYSTFRNKMVGTNPREHHPSSFVVCIQNHDQIGNRMLGDRIGQLISFEMRKLVAATLFIAPYTPLLFMGEEYLESQPFQYFVNHSDPSLIQAVQEGRKREFESFNWQGKVPDPQAEETFENSKLQWDIENPSNNILFTFYQHLITLRRQGAFSIFTNHRETHIDETCRTLTITGRNKSETLFAILNFSNKEQTMQLPGPHRWIKILATADRQWNGPGVAFPETEDIPSLAIPAESLIIFKRKNTSTL